MLTRPIGKVVRSMSREAIDSPGRLALNVIQESGSPGMIQHGTRASLVSGGIPYEQLGKPAFDETRSHISAALQEFLPETKSALREGLSYWRGAEAQAFNPGSLRRAQSAVTEHERWIDAVETLSPSPRGRRYAAQADQVYSTLNSGISSARHGLPIRSSI